MTAILLVWYASGWGGTVCYAIRTSELRLSQALPCFACGPVGLAIGLLMLVETLGLPDPVLWKRPE